MVTRLWQGWTTREHADAYEQRLRIEILSGIRRIPGSRGTYVRRRDVNQRVEFVTPTRFESMDAVRAFAGEDHEAAVVPPKAGALLARFDQRSKHYETVVQPD